METFTCKDCYETEGVGGTDNARTNMHEPKSVKCSRGAQRYGSKDNAPDIDYGGMSEAEAKKLLMEKYGYSEQEADQAIKTKKSKGKE